MKLSLSAFGFSLGAGFDADEARALSIDREAKKLINSERRAIEVQEVADRIRADRLARDEAVKNRVAQMRIDAEKAAAEAVEAHAAKAKA